MFDVVKSKTEGWKDKKYKQKVPIMVLKKFKSIDANLRLAFNHAVKHITENTNNKMTLSKKKINSNLSVVSRCFLH